MYTDIERKSTYQNILSRNKPDEFRKKVSFLTFYESVLYLVFSVLLWRPQAPLNRNQIDLRL